MAWTAFIFANSLKSGDESAEASQGLTMLLTGMLERMGFSPEFSEVSLVVRKTAHFTEYFLLACSLFGCGITFGAKKRVHFPITAVYCYTVAICDEFLIQAMTEGRGPSWIDTLIDLGGALAACGIISAVIQICRARRKQISR